MPQDLVTFTRSAESSRSRQQTDARSGRLQESLLSLPSQCSLSDRRPSAPRQYDLRLPLNPPPPNLSGPETASTALQSESQSDGSTRGTTTARVTDKNFRSTVLYSHGVYVEEGLSSMDIRSAYDHFKNPTPMADQVSKEEINEWYKTQHGHTDAKIWLSLSHQDAEAIAQEYIVMAAVEEEEAKFAFYGTLTFFRQDESCAPSSYNRRRATYSKMEWAPRPDSTNHLFCPPQLFSVSVVKPFRFENKPDLTFWLPLQRFNPLYRDMISGVTYVVPKAEATAPYFTIEFKKAEKDLHIAVNQLAAAGALILYNRVLLRMRRLTAYSHSWKQSDFAEIKHYGVAFAANVASIYQILPNIDSSQSHDQPDFNIGSIWQGCTVHKLARIQITSAGSVVELRSWVNEIQNWGLGSYADELTLDLKGLLRLVKGGKEKASLRESEIERSGM